jgi:hypothetical protein
MFTALSNRDYELKNARRSMAHDPANFQRFNALLDRVCAARTLELRIHEYVCDSKEVASRVLKIAQATLSMDNSAANPGMLESYAVAFNLEKHGQSAIVIRWKSTQLSDIFPVYEGDRPSTATHAPLVCPTSFR